MRKLLVPLIVAALVLGVVSFVSAQTYYTKFLINGTERARLDDTGLFAANQLQSTVVTGTAPLIVASSTLVSNLNAQYLNGHDGTYYGASTAVILAPNSSVRNVVQPTASTYIPLTVKGFASQSVDLTEWVNSSGTVLAKIDQAGVLYTDSISSVGNSITIRPNTGGTGVIYLEDYLGLGQLQINDTNFPDNVSLRGMRVWSNGTDSNLILGVGSGGYVVPNNDGSVSLGQYTDPTHKERWKDAIFTNTVTSAQFVSNVPIGSQPYACTSTTENTNLNANYLEGHNAAYFQTAGTFVTSVTGTAPIQVSVGTTPVVSITSVSSSTAGAVVASGTPVARNFLRAAATTGAIAWDTLTSADVGLSNVTNNAQYYPGGTDVAITDGGTGASTKAGGFDALSPMSGIGDMIYGGTAGTGTRLVGDTTNTRKFLRQLSVGGVSTAPAWDTILAADIPTLNQSTTGSAAKWTAARLLAGNSVDGSAAVPFANKFIVQGTADSGLSGAQFLGALGNGIVKNTTSTGVLSIASAGVDYQAVGNYITGLTGGVTASGPGLASAVVVTNANLTGPITSLGNATVVASQTGTGSTFVMNSTPTLVTPVLGSATATTINKVAITAPSSSATLTLANGSTLATAGAFSATLTSTAATNVTLPTSGTLQGCAAAATPATIGIMTVTMTSAAQTVFTITPTGACTFNASGGTAGARMSFIVTTSGVSSYVLTWGTNFKSTGTLTTGTTTAKVFTVNFVCKDGTTWCETSRTTAM